MKSYIGLFLFTAFIGLSTLNLNAQDDQSQTTTATEQTQTKTQSAPAPKPKPFPDSLDVLGQFNYAIEKSSDFREYKVIRQTWVSKLRSNTLDTLKNIKKDLNSAQNMIQAKVEIIDSVEAELTTVRTQLEAKNSFSLLGLMVSKKTYDSIMWGVIISLVVAFGIMFAAFRRSFSVTSQTKKDLTDVKDEFEDFRKKALKSKEEAVRQLYDELNKYKNRS